jgi:hypothetical protein
MFASRSRAGVSLVDSAMVLPFVGRAVVRTVLRGIQQRNESLASSTLGESADVSDRMASPGRNLVSRLGFIELSTPTSHP